MTYQTEKATQDSLYAEVTRTGEVLRAFPRNEIGLTPDAVKQSPEYRAAKDAYRRAFAKLQKFNTVFVKKYAKELRIERAELEKRRTSGEYDYHRD